MPLPRRPRAATRGAGFCLIGPALVCALSGCVPEGPPTEQEVLVPAAAPIPGPTSKEGSTPDPLLTKPWIDEFDRAELGDDYRRLSAAWRIEAGQLCGTGAKNQGVWLARRIPTNAVIEFDARSDSTEGDIKVEVWGDGRSGATKNTYDDASSYLIIFGGWKNRYHVLARLDEHADDRLAVATREGADDPRARPVSLGQVYRFTIERRDGKTVRWSVDDELIHEMVDEEPLTGPGHDHLGFNDWQAHVCFDNLRITPL